MTVVDKNSHAVPDWLAVNMRHAFFMRLLLTPEFSYHFIGPGVENFCGYKPEEFYAYPNLAQEIVISGWPTEAELVSYKQTDIIEQCVRHRDGTLRWCEIEIINVIQENGRNTMLESMVHDISRRKTVELALRDSEENYRTLVEAAGEPIFSLDENGKFLFLNNCAATYFNGKPQDFVGKTMWDLFPQKIADRQVTTIRETIASNKGYVVKEEPTLIQGELRWYRTSISALNPRSGQPRSAMLIARDITAQKRFESSLKLFRDLLDQSSDGVFVLDPQTYKFLDVNSTACEQLGYTREQLLELTLLDIEAVDSFLEVKFQTLENDYAATQTGMYRRRDGSLYPVEVNSKHVIIGGNGYLISVARDISERRKTEQAMRESEDKYRTIAEHASDGIALILHERVVYANRAFHEMLQYGGGELNGAVIQNVLPDTPKVQELLQRINNALAASLGAVHNEMQLLAKSGKLLDVYISAKRVPVGDKFGVLVLAKDVTTLRSLEQQLIRTERAAAVGTLAGGVAHEFNNLIVSILGFSQLALEREGVDAELREWLERIGGAARRGRNITQSLLAFSRPHETPRKHGNLAQAARDSLELISKQFENSGVDLSVKLRPTAAARMDQTQIGQVVLNFLINAQHATLGRPDRRIKIETGRNGGRIFVRVADNGCGIPKANLTKIFSPFFSTKGEYAGSSPMAAVKGTGLGLSICHKIAEYHDGEIEVESEEGKGSTFTLWLPVTDEKEPDDAGSEAAAVSEAGGLSVLVVDDEKDTRDLVSLVLGRRGHSVSVTADADEGFRMVAAGGVDLVFVDLYMPGVSGFEFLKNCRKLAASRRPECVVMTGRVTSALAEECTRLGATGLLTKPFELHEIEAIVEKARSARG